MRPVKNGLEQVLWLGRSAFGVTTRVHVNGIIFIALCMCHDSFLLGTALHSLLCKKNNNLKTPHQTSLYICHQREAEKKLKKGRRGSKASKASKGSKGSKADIQDELGEVSVVLSGRHNDKNCVCVFVWCNGKIDC